MLLSEIREERNWDKAQENYEDVQRVIIRAEDMELYGDVERFVPEGTDPKCIEMVMEIEEYTREDGPAKRVAKSPSKKTKRVRDPKRNIPTGAASGFVVASHLVPKTQDLMNFNADVSSDSDDREIEAGLHGPRRTVSMPAAKGKGKKGKAPHEEENEHPGTPYISCRTASSLIHTSW